MTSNRTRWTIAALAAGAVVGALIGRSAIAAAFRPEQTADARPVRFQSFELSGEQSPPLPPAPKPVPRKLRRAAPDAVRPKAAAAQRPVTAPPAPVASSRPAAPAPVARGGPANNTALLIGVNNAPGSEPLQGMVQDTKMMRAALLKAGYKRENIVVLNDGAATYGAILAQLDRLATRTSGKGTAVVSISSHAGRSGGDMTFASGGGGRVSRTVLASRLAKIPGRVWTTISTCYAAAFEAPGLVGKDRIAVFTSSADEYSYQNERGSVALVSMIQHGMLDRGIRTIEGAYRYAVSELKRSAPDRTPILKDGISGDVTLGSVR